MRALVTEWTPRLSSRDILPAMLAFNDLGRHLEGNSKLLCVSSLHWSPNVLSHRFFG